MENIGDYAFQNCKSLTSFNSVEIGVFNIPENVTNISNYAFYGCEKATTITLGKDVSIVGNYAFSGCANINKFNSVNEYELIVPTKVINIGEYAFQDIQLVKIIVVPDSVTSIGLGAFKGCNSIEDITLPFVGATETATYHEAVFGYVFGYRRAGASEHKTEFNSNYIDDYPYAKEKSQEYVEKTYACNIEAINQYNAYDYKGTANIYSGSWSAQTRYGLSSYYYYIPVTIKNVTITSQTNIPVAAFNNCDFIETITLSEDVETIGDYAFQNCNATILYK